ncbi:hypothetical protein EVAR_54769_1 [Eumeta japonica]|uniref:Uncharacterized protein n=1 Tax=Eumeta variegata TaxID=151549 RepID=A0A4C1YG08_EUMVA|nr:hypothetical protein EVAR_54769_1 [Eumeta japonica]
MKCPTRENDDNVQLGATTMLKPGLGTINNDHQSRPAEHAYWRFGNIASTNKRQVTSAVMSRVRPARSSLARPHHGQMHAPGHGDQESGTKNRSRDKKWLKVNDTKKLASIRIPSMPAHRGELCVRRRERKSYAAAVYWRIKLSEHEAVSPIAGARVAP